MHYPANNGKQHSMQEHRGYTIEIDCCKALITHFNIKQGMLKISKTFIYLVCTQDAMIPDQSAPSHYMKLIVYLVYN